MGEVERPMKRCTKRGHVSRGKAEAHMRSLLRAQEFNPDRRYKPEKLHVYICAEFRCRAHPYHVGHDPR